MCQGIARRPSEFARTSACPVTRCRLCCAAGFGVRSMMNPRRGEVSEWSSDTRLDGLSLCATIYGEVSEWLKEHAWKVCKRLNPASRVRIPPSPPVLLIREGLNAVLRASIEEGG